MMVILLLLTLPILFILYFSHKTQPPTNEPPGPPGLPLIGNLHHFDGKLPHLYLHRLSKQYGSLFSLNLGFRRVVVISSADVVKEIMKSYDVEFSGRPVLVALQKLSYNGLDVAFSQYNEAWREMRKIATIHLFTTKKIQSFHPICKDEVSKMVKKIALDASLSRVTNLSEMIVSLANNSIFRMAFGKTYGGEDDLFQKSLFDLLLEAQVVLGGFFVEDFLPSFKWIDYLTGMKTKLEKSFYELDCLYEEVINEHLNPDRPKSMEGDVLDTLLQLKRNGTSSVDLTMDHIKAVLMNMIAGGTDTVSAAIVWALTALINNPLIMKKVQTELRDSFGENKDVIDEEDVAKLDYLKAIIKESLRLYPPAPLVPPRETIKKCCLNGYDIEADTMVFINAWAIGRDPEKWNDPDKFWPERFLESDVDVRGRDPEVIPFGIGRRGCPGISFAMTELEICLANVLYKFDWELPDGVKDVDFDVWPGMTMHKKNDLILLPKLVNNA